MTYEFRMFVDHSAKLYVDDILVVDGPYVYERFPHVGTLSLTSGVHSLTVEYIEFDGSANISLSWEEAPIRLRQVTSGNIFTIGSTPAIDVVGEIPGTSYRITDYRDRVVLGPTGIGSTGAWNRLSFPFLGNGYYVLTVSGGGYSATTSLAVVPAFSDAEEDMPLAVNTHFGQVSWNETWRDVPTIMELARKAGVRQIRDGLAWCRVEQKLGVYAFIEELEKYMQLAPQYGIRTSFIASEYGNLLYGGGDAWWHANIPYTDEAIDAYAEYVRQVLLHYPGQIESVETFPEFRRDHPGPGEVTPAAYLDLVKHCYQAVKSVSPNTLVCSPGDWPVDLAWLESLFQLGFMNHVDVISLHAYRFGSAPEGIDEIWSAVDALVRKYNGGISKPMWDTEMGIGWTEEDSTQAAWLVRNAALMLGEGVSRWDYYLFVNEGTAYNQSGVLRIVADEMGPLTPRTSYVALAVANKVLCGAKSTGEQDLKGAYVRAFQTNAGPVTVAWSPDKPCVAAIPSATAISVTDMVGGKRDVMPVSGIVYVTLDEYPVYIHTALPLEWATDNILSVSPGWNLVSMSVPLPVAFIRGFQSGYGYHDGWSVLSTSQTLVPGEAYWVQVENSESVPLIGTVSTGSLSMTFQAGWQLLGNPFDVAIPIDTILGREAIKTCYSYDSAWGAVNLSTGMLEPGRGYWIELTSPVTVTLPKPSRGQTLAYFHVDEAAGSECWDSAYVYSGTLTGNVHFDTATKKLGESSLASDGTHWSWVETTMTVPNSNLYAEAWVYYTSNLAGTILTNKSAGWLPGTLWFGFLPGDVTPVLAVEARTYGTVAVEAPLPSTVDINQWVKVAFSCVRGKSLALYINDQLVAETTTAVPNHLADSMNLKLGYYPLDSAPYHSLCGNMDELLIALPLDP
jgi:hypothetical protein